MGAFRNAPKKTTICDSSALADEDILYFKYVSQQTLVLTLPGLFGIDALRDHEKIDP